MYANFFVQAVTSIDLVRNDAADENVVIQNLNSWTDQHQEVADGLKSVLKDEKIDALFCVAGGWAGGNAASKSNVALSLFKMVYRYEDCLMLRYFWSESDLFILVSISIFLSDYFTSNNIVYCFKKRCLNYYCRLHQKL